MRKAKSKGFKDSRVRGVKGKRISWQSSVDRIRDQDSSLKRKDFYKSTILGGSLIGLFNPIEAIQLSAEFVELNVNRKWENYLSLEDEKYWYPALFVGAGYRTQNITFGLRYDLLYNEEKSIFADAWMPFVRVYF